MKLVSLDEAKLRLRVDTDAMDVDLDLMIAGASRAVMRYIESGRNDFTDSAGEVFEDTSGNAIDVPDDVKNATLMLVGTWLRDPAGVDAASWQAGYLPVPVMSILYPLRDPSLA